MDIERIVVEDALIVTLDGDRRHIRGDLVVEGGRIVQVGGKASPTGSGVKQRVIPGKDRVLLPGFVQTHVHLCQTLFRNQADDLSLLEWLRDRVWPLEAALDEETLHISARLGCAELLAGGTTTILDMATVRHTDAVFEAVETSGIRALVGKALMDIGDDVPGPLLEDPAVSLAESESLATRWTGAGDGRIGYALAPRFAVSCSEPLLLGVQSLAERLGLLVHTHAAENQDEVALIESRTGMRNVTYLDHLGLTGPRLLMAHGIWLDESEMNILQQSGTHVLHCPSSNLKLRSGIAKVPQMRNRGISVSLGADGAPCNNRLDMFREMRLAALLHASSPDGALSAEDILEMATIGGARALGLENDVGSLEVGKKADVIALDLSSAHNLPETGTHPASRIVYSAGSRDVAWTMVDGAVAWDRSTGHPTDLVDNVEQAARHVRDRAFGGA